MIAETLLKTFKLDKLFENLMSFIETRIDLIKYDIKSEVSKSLSTFLFSVIVVFLLNLVLLFISLSVTVWISREVGWIAGFGIMGTFYLVVTLLLLLFRKSIMEKLGETFMGNINKK